jgi:hypothetical protein
MLMVAPFLSPHAPSPGLYLDVDAEVLAFV